MTTIIDEIYSKIDQISCLFEKTEIRDRSASTLCATELLSELRTLCTEQHILLNSRLNITSKLSNPSYAEVVRGSCDSTTVLIYPKNDVSDSTETMEELKKQLNPDDLSLCVQKTRMIKNSGVAVTVANRTQAEQLLTTANQGQFKCKVQSKRHPFIKIHSISNTTSDIEISTAISKQTAESCSNSDAQKIKIVRRSKVYNREQADNVFVQVDPFTWKCLIEKRGICIKWEKLLVSNHVPVIRCFNCQGYGHQASKCKAKTSCGHCGGKHETRSCRFVIKTGLCVNCLSKDKSDKSQCNHAAYSNECPVFLSVKRSVEETIYYPTWNY